jgi:transcriptional regulator with XRE-family HTH domain
MLARMNTRSDVAPQAGLFWGSTSHTEITERLAFGFGATAAPRRLIIDAPSTSITLDRRVADLLHTDAGPLFLLSVRPEALRGFLPSVRSETLRGFHGREAIFELRRLTGLTWEELAEVMSVSRRSLHLWANGQRIYASNEKRLRDLVSAMRTLDRGTARENRALLISPRPGGGVFSDLLREGRFAEALALAGRGNGRPRVSEKTSAEPLPTASVSVEDSFNTRSDRVHIDEGLAVPRRQRRPRPLQT